jgi:hypothetical protein
VTTLAELKKLIEMILGTRKAVESGLINLTLL